MDNEYEVIIIGGGPAGLTAGLYTSRARLKSLVLERGMMGGLITETPLVENYPGFAKGISGSELGLLIHEQAISFGLETQMVNVTDLQPFGEKKVVVTDHGNFSAKAIIIATGSERRKLGIPGEEEFSGKGVSYCGTCDAPFFKNKTVAIVGGGNVAATEALHLSKFASKVYLIHRRDQLRAARIMHERVTAESRIETIWDTVIDAIEGPNMVKRLKLHHVKTKANSTLDVDGVFVSVGIVPNTSFFKSWDKFRESLPLDHDGYVITNDRMETDIPGVFAAGDVRLHSAKQAITAAGDGATAAIYVDRYITNRSISLGLNPV
jgi:thioredoxin reductase (NADPH)